MASRPISPTEPVKKYPPPVQPNAHPYAIKTTSSALLSRSNSSPHSAHHHRHHYVPFPPSQNQAGSGARHRHSSSLPSVEREAHDVNDRQKMQALRVASLDDVSLKRADEPNFAHRVRRAETMPSSATKLTGSSRASGSELYASLPSDPKQWNTDKLVNYLETSFKLNNDTNEHKYDFSIVSILEYVRARGLTGRELLRLTGTDLVDTPLSEVQCAALLNQSRTLRADTLRGHMHVDLNHSHAASYNSQAIHTHSARSLAPSHMIHGYSASVDNLLDDNTDEGQSILAPSPVPSLHHRSSVSDASTQRYRDLARMRIRRRGRVKGLVETWERVSTSGSECSASEAESESEADLGLESTADAKHSPEFPSVLPHSSHDEPSQNTCSLADPSPVVPQGPLSSTLPPPYAYMYSPEAIGDVEDEPNIEELLASSSDTPLKGARAWEADFGLGDTVKRVPRSVDADRSTFLITEQDVSRPQDNGHRTKSCSTRSKDPGTRRNAGSRGKCLKTQRRVVSAIFTGSSEEVPENLGGGPHLDRRRFAGGSSSGVRSETPAHSGPQNDPDDVLRALEESIAVTRTQLEVYRIRLEKVEADTARYEAILLGAQFSDSCRFSEFGLRQRRLSADGETTADATELPRNAFAAGARNRDVLRGWETMSLAGITRAIVPRAIGWLVPFGRMDTSVPGGNDESRAHSRSYSGDNSRYPPPGKRNGRFSVGCMSYTLILFSFTICAAVLRRMGFGRWLSRP